MWTMLNIASVAVILIEEPTSIYGDLYVTLVRRTEPMGKKQEAKILTDWPVIRWDSLEARKETNGAMSVGTPI
jgi:hypothetical protein